MKKKLLKNANIYILEGFIVSRICNHHICHPTNTCFNAIYVTYTTKGRWMTVISLLHVPNDILVKIKLLKNANIYILEGSIMPRICSHHTCHSANTYFNWKILILQIKARWITILSILHVLNDILVKIKLLKNANVYILEGFIVPRIFSHQTYHSTNTYFNWKYENYIEKLCE